MKLIATKKILEVREDSFGSTEEIFEVLESETVGEMLARMCIYGRYGWEFTDLEVKIKLVREGIES